MLVGIGGLSLCTNVLLLCEFLMNGFCEFSPVCRVHMSLSTRMSIFRKNREAQNNFFLLFSRFHWTTEKFEIVRFVRTTVSCVLHKHEISFHREQRKFQPNICHWDYWIKFHSTRWRRWRQQQWHAEHSQSYISFESVTYDGGSDGNQAAGSSSTSASNLYVNEQTFDKMLISCRSFAMPSTITGNLINDSTYTYKHTTEHNRGRAPDSLPRKWKYCRCRCESSMFVSIRILNCAREAIVVPKQPNAVRFTSRSVKHIVTGKIVNGTPQSEKENEAVQGTPQHTHSQTHTMESE